MNKDKFRSRIAGAAVVALVVAGLTPDSVRAEGADVTVGDIPDEWNWGSSGGIRAYSVGTDSCNVGDVPLQWMDEGATPTLHPVISQNIYRLMDGQFEQIGQAWLKHGFCALQQSLCESCSPYCGGCCDHLGVGCSDPYGAYLNGIQGGLGPKSEINPATGEILVWPFTTPGSGTLAGRLQVDESDLDEAQNPGALYFVSSQYVAHDDATAGNNLNNASYREVTVGSAPSYNLTLIGSTVRQKSALVAWKVEDPGVEFINMDVPDDGRLTLGHRATDLGEGMWHYEYALFNLNSDRAAQSFSVPIPDDAAVSNFGFHDVDYWAEPYASDDWPATTVGGSLTWACEPQGDNDDANALRWDTLYNFRFDSDGPPETGDITVGLFKPGDPESMVVQASRPGADCNDNNSADSVDIDSGDSEDNNGNGIPDECEEACEGDANGDGTVDPLDSGYVLARFGCPVGTGDPSCDAADQNGDGAVDPLDSGFVMARFGDCP